MATALARATVTNFDY